MTLEEVANEIGTTYKSFKVYASWDTCDVPTFKRGRLRYGNTIKIADYIDRISTKVA